MHFTYRGDPFPLDAAKKCVGPGWSGLVEECYNTLPDGSTIEQIKEKYGGLRFYCVPHHTAIDAIEARSQATCEDCGKPGETRPTPRGTKHGK